MGSDDVQRILVWLPNWVGDVVMATPALAALRERFASARITLVGRPAALAILAGSAWADDSVVDETRGANVFTWIPLARRLRRERFDVAVLLPNSFRVAAIAAMGGANRIFGSARDGRGLLLSDKVLPPRDFQGKLKAVPALQYYACLAETLGADCAGRPMSLPLSDGEAAAAEGELRRAGADAGRPLVMLNPGAAFGTSKLWAADRYAQLADALIEKRGAQIIVNAAPAERAIAAAVVGAMKHKPLLDFAGRDNSLGLLKGLLARADLLVTNDTGARHVGAAMGAGVVTIFGSTDPEWTRLDYPGERILRADVPCSPCQKKFCRLSEGLSHHQCMKAITVEMVLAAAEELLAGRPSDRRERFAPAVREGPARGAKRFVAVAEGPLANLLERHGLDDPKAVMEYGGGEDLVKPGLNQRRRTRLELTDDAGTRHVLFLKRYAGLAGKGTLAGIRRRWTFGKDASPAEVEARNIEAVQEAGVATMQCMAWNAGPWGSYIITTCVPGEALERCGAEFWERRTQDESAGSALASGLADIVRKLHAAGCVHRDLYACHVFADEREGQLNLYLIDLARVFRPRWRRFRWRVKDLAQLHFSLPQTWRDRWWELLLREYLGEGLHYTAPRWQRAVRAKSRRIARRGAKTQARA